LRPSDDDIMREAAGSRPAAFAEIFERYHGRIYGYLRKLVGTSDGAHDLTQETFVLAFRSRDTYRPRGRFQAWLYRIATNLARGRFQEIERERMECESAPLSAVPDPGVSAAGPSDALESAETRRIVATAIARLSLEEREVVLLRHFEGLRFTEIAAMLGISESTVKSRMRYALEKLENILHPLKRELQ
jgi:RNA polymerase sigma-70 factor (ECF subfamily)